MHLTLRHKVNSAIIITFIFIAFLFTLIQLPFRQHQLERSIGNIEMLLQTLVERDTEQLANEIFDARITAISIRLKGMRKVEGILGIGVLDHNGKVLVTSGSDLIDQDLDQEQSEKIRKHAQLEKIESKKLAGILYSKKLSFLGEQLGFIRIHYSLQQVEREQRFSLLIFVSLLFTILLAMLVLLNLILSKFILHPITYLRDATQFIVEGNLDKDIVMQRRDELGSLAESFRIMRNAIKEQIARLSVEVEERRLAEHNLKITLDSIGDGVITTDIDGKIAKMNPIAEQLTGWHAKEAQGKPLNQIFTIVDNYTGIDADTPVDKIMISDRMEVIAERAMLISKEGVEYLIFRSGAPIRSEDGETLGVVLVFRDITEEHTLQERLRQGQKMEAIGLMAGGVAHDLNNILSGVVGYPDILLTMLPEESSLRQPLESIRESGLRAAEVVMDLLTIARSSANPSEIGNLNNILNQYLDSLEFKKLKSDNPKVAFHLKLDENLDNIYCSSSHIRKCLMNLIINGAEAINDNGFLAISTRTQNFEQDEQLDKQVVKGQICCY